MSGSRRERGLSILEVLLTLTILALILVPIIQIFNSSHRMGTSARRLVDVTVHAQALVEAVAELDPADFPTLPAAAAGQTAGTVLMDDDGKSGGGGTPKYQELCDYFKRPKPLDDMKRALSARKLAGGEVEVCIEVEWYGVVGEERTKQKIVLPMLATPRNWQ